MASVSALASCIEKADIRKNGKRKFNSFSNTAFQFLNVFCPKSILQAIKKRSQDKGKNC